MKTLIVDDSALSRRVLRRALLVCGLDESDLREAEDGMQALAMLSAQPAELLFCDLHMPRMDGRSLLASLRRGGALAGLRVVVLSSEAHRLSAEERERLGVTELARKPVRPEEIQAIVQAVATGGQHHG